MSVVYDELKNHFKSDDSVTVLSGFGAQGIKKEGKLFVMFMKGDIVVKMPPERVSEIIKSGDGQPYDHGTGKPMNNWVLIPSKNKGLWLKYSEEAKNY